MIHPIIYKESSNTLTIKGDDLKRLKKKPKQILWVKDGIYGMIPIEVVRNTLTNLADSNTQRKAMNWGVRLDLTFHWNETVEIPQSTGRVMEESNGGKK